LAKKDNKSPLSGNKTIATQLQNISNRMSGIYKDTYSTTPDQLQRLDGVTTDIEKNISKILDRNSSDDISGISKMYSKLKLDQTVTSKEYSDSIVGYFENSNLTNQLLTTYMDNKWIKELDMEIDTVCKYMPKLDEALDALKDAVLSADNFEKDCLTMNSSSVGPDETGQFATRMESIKEKYDLESKADEWYAHASKRGEAIIYNVPYSKAMSALLHKKDAGITNGGLRLHENAICILQESTYASDAHALENLKSVLGGLKDNEDFKTPKTVMFEMCNSGIIESVVTESTKMRELLPICESYGVYEQAQVLEEAGKTSPSQLDNTFPGEFKFPKGIMDGTAADGTINTKANMPDKLKVPGMLIKELDHSNVILLYMNDVCLGYYYMEFLDESGNELYSDTVFKKKSGYINSARDADRLNQSTATDTVLRFMSDQIVNQIDSKFINANPDLTKEIYSILDYNDIKSNSSLSTIRMTFIPPQDIEHIRFNIDPVTHRGISDLARSLIPAKLWCCLYITYTIGIITRGQDKRVYYVKQNVEQNIAQTLMNVISQVKKNNFNIMQIENMNSILNMTGQFNDFIIPVGQSGDPPINMEVMAGQEINPQTELMDKLEETAINAIGVPIELITARLSMDFATQLTMTNNKFMRLVFKRQTKYEKPLSRIISKIYNVECDSDMDISISCVLPTPMMLNMTNLNSIMQLVSEQATTLASIEYADSDEDVDIKRPIFIRNYVRMKLNTYIKQNDIDMIKNASTLEYNKIKPKKESEQV